MVFRKKISRILAVSGIVALSPFFLPAHASTVIGAYLPGDGWNEGELDVANSTLAKPLAIQNVFSAFTHTWDQLYWQSSYIHASGATPLISWMPVDLSRSEDNLLAEIAVGNWDSYIDDWADAMVAWVKQYPEDNRPQVLIRFAHEFNGNWYPYSNSPELYKSAWRHIHERFEQSGSNQYVQWVWSANNVSADDYNDITLYYPGDDVTDWTSLDGYNWGSNYSWSAWDDFATTFGPAYNLLVTQYPDKPVMIAEMSSAEPTDLPNPMLGQYGNDADAYESKDTWMQDALERVETDFTAVKAVVLFDIDKELSWSISDLDSTGKQGLNNALVSSHFVMDIDEALAAETITVDASLDAKPNKQNREKGRKNTKSRSSIAESDKLADSSNLSLTTEVDATTQATLPTRTNKGNKLSNSISVKPGLSAKVKLPPGANERARQARAGLRKLPAAAKRALQVRKLDVIDY